MVSLKSIAVAYAAVNLLGVDASPCRPSSSTFSGSETQTSSSVLSASTSGSSAIPTDTTASKELTVSSDETTTGSPTSSGSETLSVTVSLSEPATSDIATLSTIATSSDATISVDLTSSIGSTTSDKSTTSGASTMSAETTASTDTTESTGTTTAAGPDTTTTADTTADTTTAADTTTTVDTTTAADTTTTLGSTTVSEEPTTTTSACVEPTNMLREASFEESTGAWGFYWSGGYVDPKAEKPRTGSGAAVLPVPDGQERRMEQRVHIVPGTEYTIRFYYALPEVPSVNTQCFLFATFDYYTTLKRAPIPSDTDYHQYTANFVAADNLDPAIEIGVACPKVNNGFTLQVFIDDASVLGAACDAAPPESSLLVPAEPEPTHCPINVIEVPGFESMDGSQSWSFDGPGEFVEDESNARTGKFEALLNSVSEPDYGTSLEQVFSSSDLAADETYDFHFFWKPKSLPDNGQCYVYSVINNANTALTYETVAFGATSSTGYTISSGRFTMPQGDVRFSIVFFCDAMNGQQLEGSVYVDDTALIQVGGCEAYPETGALIENPSFEVRATGDSTYAWFGTSGVSIRAGTTPNGPSPQSGNNYLYVQLDSTRKSATVTKPLASTLNPSREYTIGFSWTAGAAYTTGDCSFALTLGSATDTLTLSSQVTPYEYQAFTASLTPNEATSSMTLEVQCKDVFPDFVFDDFTLQ